MYILLFASIFVFDLLKCENIPAHEENLENHFQKSLIEVNSILADVQTKIKSERDLLRSIDYGDMTQKGFFDYSITDIWWPTIPPSTSTLKQIQVELNFTVNPGLGFELTRRSTTETPRESPIQDEASKTNAEQATLNTEADGFEGNPDLMTTLAMISSALGQSPGLEMDTPESETLDYERSGFSPPGLRITRNAPSRDWRPGYGPTGHDAPHTTPEYITWDRGPPVPDEEDFQETVSEPETDTTTEPVTEAPITPVIIGRPSFTPFHPLDFVRNLTIGSAMTSTPSSLLLEGVPSVNMSSTTLSPYRQELDKFMEEQYAGYFTTFITKLLELVATKPQTQVKQLCEEFNLQLNEAIGQERLLFLGPKLHGVLVNMVDSMLRMPGDVLQSKATVFHSLMVNRKMLMSPEVGSLLTFIDSMYIDEDGEQLLTVLEDIKHFPIPDMPTKTVTRKLLESILGPLVTLGHTEISEKRRQNLLDTVQMLVEKNEDQFAGAPARRRGTRIVTPAMKSVLKTINRFISKGYKRNKHKQHQRDQSDKLKKAHGHKHMYRGLRHKHDHAELKTKKISHKHDHAEPNTKKISHKHDHAEPKTKKISHKQTHREYKTGQQAHNYNHKKHKAEIPMHKYDHRHHNTVKKSHKYVDKEYRQGHNYERILSKKYDHQTVSDNIHYTTYGNKAAANLQKRFNIVNSDNWASKYSIHVRAKDKTTVPSYEDNSKPKKLNFNPVKTSKNKMLRKIIASSSVSDEEKTLVANLYDAFYHGNKSALVNDRRLGYDASSASGTDDEALLKTYIYKYFGQDHDAGIKDLSS